MAYANTSSKAILANKIRWDRHRALDPNVIRIRDWIRFWSKVEKTNSCWLWRAESVHKFGYGRFSLRGKHVEAHRYAYENCIGPIPKGLQIDHLCRVPACVNPKHLEVVTRKENLLRGFSPMAILARRTHCLRGGHPLSGENLFINAHGQRECYICRREIARLRWKSQSSPAI
jgi:hypothetical protein